MSRPNQNDPGIVVLIVEDDSDMREMLSQALLEEGFEVRTATDGEQAMIKLERAQFDVLLTDLKMPGASGLDLLEAAQARNLHQPVIVMTAFGSIDSAVTAMKRGAYSYITKPFDLDDLICLIHEVAAQIRPRKLAEHQVDHGDDGDDEPVIYQSASFKGVMQQVRSVSDSQANVLIYGEAGTGKKLIARQLHRLGVAPQGPFVTVDLNAIAPKEVDVVLFSEGHCGQEAMRAENAGSLQRALGGTLFLDAVDLLPPSSQAGLLRLLQDKDAAKPRLICSCQQDLRSMVQEGEFHEDLFYRLAVTSLSLPPLRERRADIPVLAYHFLHRLSPENKVTGFRPEVMDLLVDAPWPGNVRQLQGVVDHAVIFRKTGLIQKRDLPGWFLGELEQAVTTDARSLEAVEREHILNLLEECQGNRSRTARILGINRRTLIRKLVAYGLSAEEE